MYKKHNLGFDPAKHTLPRPVLTKHLDLVQQWRRGGGTDNLFYFVCIQTIIHHRAEMNTMEQTPCAPDCLGAQIALNSRYPWRETHLGCHRNRCQGDGLCLPLSKHPSL